MTEEILASSSTERLEWDEASALSSLYGPKGALLLSLPRTWVPPFILLSPNLVDHIITNQVSWTESLNLEMLVTFLKANPTVIIRSSIIDETIWERGSFKSVRLEDAQSGIENGNFAEVLKSVRESAPQRRVAVIVQRFIEPQFHGEFGNLLRISKTRDHWEVSSVSASNFETRNRLNSQRDIAADADRDLGRYIKPSDHRSFGSIAAWINSELLHDSHRRVNLEWVFGRSGFFVVQIDEEIEDVRGINPFQIRVPHIHRGAYASGSFIRVPTAEDIEQWDKLAVLEELWGPGDDRRPLLFALAPNELDLGQSNILSALETEFSDIIGPDNIIIRTSVRRDREKVLNLPKTEGLSPLDAAKWCVEKIQSIPIEKGISIADFAFVAHRFIPSSASAWAVASPASPEVEIHVNWGVADALQFYPYDIVDVHVPTRKISYTPQYKSHCIISRSGGSWENVRVKNEVARNQCISRGQALDVATRSLEIARRIGKPCHIMWFVGCSHEGDAAFNVPWYWVKADDERPNPDRQAPQSIVIRSRADLERLSAKSPEAGRFAVELAPSDLNLMRDNAFLEEVSVFCMERGAPVVLNGSTLAHAFYQLQKSGCIVIVASSRSVKRTRNIAPMGKLVRDKIPSRILRSEEHAQVRDMPGPQVISFLTAKLVEELMEFRRADDAKSRVEELGDTFEVLSALIDRSGISFDQVVKAAAFKREKAGGFDKGIVLYETSIGSRRGDSKALSVLPLAVSDTQIDLPFTFFGFGQFDRRVRVALPTLDLDVFIKLSNDRISLEFIQVEEQLDLDLDQFDED